MNFTIKNQVINTTIIKKSEFICYLMPVNNLEEVKQLLEQIRTTNISATHNVYAYVLNNHSIQKCSDDGEPNRTAGYPILNILLNNQIDNCLCVVSRYFGGIKLGGGGLIRAYANAANEAIKLAELVPNTTIYKYELCLDYKYVDQIEQYCNEKQIQIIDKSFIDKVYFNILVEETLEQALLDDLSYIIIQKTID